MDRDADTLIHSTRYTSYCTKLQLSTSSQSKDFLTQTFAQSAPFFNKIAPNTATTSAMKSTTIHTYDIKTSS